MFFSTAGVPLQVWPDSSFLNSAVAFLYYRTQMAEDPFAAAVTDVSMLDPFAAAVTDATLPPCAALPREVPEADVNTASRGAIPQF